ncbi:MAG TPA: chemotaxis protein CheA [Usitatibacter sp.]|nr:chemotaxis protein CheA [Usitatibacter sp.]
MAIDLNRFIATFFDEAQEHLEAIEDRAMTLESGREDPEILNAIFRAAHSIKGGSGTFGFTQLAEATHVMETLFDDLRKGRGHADQGTVRLLLDACDVFKAHLARLKAGERRADASMDEIRGRIAAYRDARLGEGSPQPAASANEAPVEAQPQEERFFDTPGTAAPKEDAFGLFDDAPGAPAAAAPAAAAEKFGLFETPQPAARAEQQSSIRVSVEKIDRIVNLVGELVIAQAMMQQSVGQISRQEDEHLTHNLSTLDRNTRELQQAVMSIRMMPMEFVFSRFPRLVYDVSAQLGKKVQLRTSGHETELDKELIELLIDPLTHVVRNAIDHGIESPAERLARGKPESGTVGMRATHRGGSVIIEVSDDGRGIDRERIIAKARELGIHADESMGDEEVFEILFEAGFSTAKEVTNLSGRGVGMDVVRRNINALGGSVSISSAKGEGTVITIQLPLTLAVLDGMIVCVGDEQYIIPLEFVAEAFKPAAGDIKTIVNQASLVAVRGEHLPIVRLEDLVQLPASQAPRPEPLCLVVEVDNRRAALLVDSLIGQQQLVVKSLEANLHRVAGIAGATILGDGRVALILDVTAFTRNVGTRAAAKALA